MLCDYAYEAERARKRMRLQQLCHSYGHSGHFYRAFDENQQKMNSKRNLISKSMSLSSEALEAMLKRQQPEIDEKKSTQTRKKGQ